MREDPVVHVLDEVVTVLRIVGDGGEAGGIPVRPEEDVRGAVCESGQPFLLDMDYPDT